MKKKKTHLISLRVDDYNHLEGFSLGEGFIRYFLFCAPVFIYKAVHGGIATNLRLVLKSDVITSFEIHVKAVKKNQ